MMLVTVLIFASFACAFLPIMGATERWGEAVKVLWKAVLIGDSDDLDKLVRGRANEGDPGRYMAFGLIVSSTLIFALGVMNLIIAVLQKEYEDIEQRADLIFQHERARLCVQYMLQPSWPSSWRVSSRGLAGGAAVVTLLVSLWFGLLRMERRVSLGAARSFAMLAASRWAAACYLA